MALLTVSCVVLYAGFVEYFWGWSTVFSTWEAVGLGPVLLALLLFVSTYFVRGYRLYSYFPRETSGRFIELFHLAQLHNLLNIMLPFRSGETSFPLLMRSEFGVPLLKGTSALLVMRLLDLHALLAAAGVGLVLRGGHSTGGEWLLWLAFLVAPLLCFQIKGPLFSFAGRRLAGKPLKIVEELEAGLPAGQGDFIRAWAVTFLNWGVKVVVFAWGLAVMGIVPLSACFGGALGGELSSVLPFHAPGGVGTYPAGIVAGAVALGAPVDKAAMDLLGKAAVSMHLLIIVSAFLGAGMSLVLAAIKRRLAKDTV
ncbi:MAG: lysylphosphatidylglycerol synthase domain-containing protein [Shinella sp.]|nr:lysylphosphatidylglycerol synthase domain-containing protein [Shinella sp.]